MHSESSLFLHTALLHSKKRFNSPHVKMRSISYLYFLLTALTVSTTAAPNPSPSVLSGPNNHSSIATTSSADIPAISRQPTTLTTRTSIDWEGAPTERLVDPSPAQASAPNPLEAVPADSNILDARDNAPLAPSAYVAVVQALAVSTTKPAAANAAKATAKAKPKQQPKQQPKPKPKQPPKPAPEPKPVPLPAEVIITGDTTGQDKDTPADIKIQAFNQKDCKSAIGGSGPAVPMKYGVLEKANILSYALSRELKEGEQLDFFTFSEKGEEVNGAPKECSKWKQSSVSKGGPKAGECYSTNSIALSVSACDICFCFWGCSC